MRINAHFHFHYVAISINVTDRNVCHGQAMTNCGAREQENGSRPVEIYRLVLSSAPCSSPDPRLRKRENTMTQREASDFPLFVLVFFFPGGLGDWRHKPIE